jgi:hypothetical protein
VLQSRFRGELFEACAKHPVESWERMNDVGERLQRRPQLDSEHELSHDLARARSDEALRDYLTMLVPEVGEPTEARDVAGSENAGPRFERSRIHLQPAALRLCEPRCAPRLEVGATPRRNQ